MAVDSLASHVELLVASLDLELVRLIRSAIRTADLSSGKLAAATAIGPAPNPEPRPYFHPEAAIEPRRHIYPDPRIEPRRVLHPEPRCEPRVCPRLGEVPPPECPEPVPACPATPSPIQPPWKVLPWDQPLPPRAVVKIVRRPPDVVHKGRLIDVFS